MISVLQLKIDTALHKVFTSHIYGKGKDYQITNFNFIDLKT
jgi:hypothetical protein